MVLPYIDMNPPRVYMFSQTWSPVPPPSPQHPSGSSPCTSPKHAVSCIRHRLVIQFLHDSIHVRVPFSQIELPYDPAIPLLGIHTEETRIERDTCTPMFIAALFIIARTWKHPRCPSADEWIRKLWYIYTMEYYSAVKKHRTWKSSRFQGSAFCIVQLSRLYMTTGKL